MNLELFCQVKIFTLVFAVLTVRGTGNILFDFQKSNPDISVFHKSENVEATFFKKTDHSTEFQITGDAGSRATWFIPFERTVVSNCEIQFEISSTNITPAKINSNVFLMLKPGRDQIHTSQNEVNATLGPTMVSVYSAEGNKDSLIGRVSFSTLKKSHTIEGFYIDLLLNASTSGSLNISNLRISFQGNIPSQNAIKKSLAKPLPRNVSIIKGKSGEPRIHVNDKSLAQLGQWNTIDSVKNKGIQGTSEEYNINRVILNFGGYNSSCPDIKPVWNYVDYIDYDYIDELLSGYGRQENRTVFIDILLASPPDWWKNLQERKFKKPVVISDLNPEWVKYCKTAVKYLIAYLRDSDYDYFIGCTLITDLDRYSQHPYAERDQHPDYKEKFQEWLTKRYGSDSELQKTWKQDAVSLDSVSHVPKEKWVKGTIGSFIHPLTAGVDRDSYLFYNESWAEFIISFARDIKMITQQNCLTGIVGGPGSFMNQLWNNDYNLTGNALTTLLKSKQIDYFDMVIDETDYRNGYGVSGMEGLLIDALNKRGKLFFTHDKIDGGSQKKNDSRMPLKNASAIQVNRRKFVANFINGTSLYFLNQSRGNLSTDFKTFQRISRKAEKLDNDMQSEVAFVIDPDVFLNLAPDHDLPIKIDANQRIDRDVQYQSKLESSHFYLFQMARIMWNRIGVPYDVVLIDDLTPDSYKTIIFFNTFNINEHRLKQINTFKNGNRTIITLWADGFVSDKYLSVQGIESLSNISITMIPGEKRFFLNPNENLRKFLGRNITDVIGWPYSFRAAGRSMKVEFSPVFGVDDDEATIFATFLDGGEAAMALKKFPEWQSFYSGSPFINPEIFRQLIRESDAHVYSDSNDLYFINRNFIGIHTLEDGIRTIELPEENSLFELFRNQEIKSQKTHHLEMDGKNTYLFFIGNKETWDGL